MQLSLLRPASNPTFQAGIVVLLPQNFRRGSPDMVISALEMQALFALLAHPQDIVDSAR